MVAAVRRHLTWAVYGILAIAILGPLLAPGYILTFDMVFVPHVPLPASIGIDYPFWAALHFISMIMPAWLIQKVLLLGMFMAAGYGAYRMLAELRPVPQPKDWQWACYFAGALYMWNPFVYSRFMAGQYLVLLGYMLLPYIFVAVWRWAAAPSVRRGSLVALLMTILGILSVHAVAFAVTLAVAITMLWACRRRDDHHWWRTIGGSMAIAALVWIVLNAYWLIPLLWGSSHPMMVASHFGAGDARAFATVPGHLGLLGNVLAMQGFWGDSRNLYLSLQDSSSWWWLWLPVFIVIVGSGMYWSWRRQRGVLMVFVILAAIGTILAIGTSGTIFAPLNRWLFDHIALFRGYREPQKWSALLVLSYTYFGGTGLYALLGFIRRKQWSNDVRQLSIALSFAAIMFSAPLMLWGFHGQVHAVQYPRDWYTLRTYLQRQDNPQVVFLPWHLYMHYDFAQRVVGNPAPKFFAAHIIASDNPDMKGATPYTHTALQDHVSGALMHPDGQFGVRLASWNVSYVLVAKEYDWHRYDWLRQDGRLQLVMDTPTMQLYKIKGEAL